MLNRCSNASFLKSIRGISNDTILSKYKNNKARGREKEGRDTLIVATQLKKENLYCKEDKCIHTFPFQTYYIIIKLLSYIVSTSLVMMNNET